VHIQGVRDKYREIAVKLLEEIRTVSLCIVYSGGPFSHAIYNRNKTSRFLVEEESDAHRGDEV